MKYTSPLADQMDILVVKVTGTNGYTRTEKVCSKCMSVINNSWNHETWCRYYELEELAKWVSK